MEKVKVNIEEFNNTYFVTANRRRIAICDFQRGGTNNDLWCFIPAISGTEARYYRSKEFPMEYFKKVCQVMWFLTIGGDVFPEIELTQEAMRLVKKA